MNEKNPTYHVAIKNGGMPPNKTYGWRSTGNGMSYPSCDHNNSLSLGGRD